MRVPAASAALTIAERNAGRSLADVKAEIDASVKARSGNALSTL